MHLQQKPIMHIAGQCGFSTGLQITGVLIPHPHVNSNTVSTISHRLVAMSALFVKSFRQFFLRGECNTLNRTQYNNNEFNKTVLTNAK